MKAELQKEFIFWDDNRAHSADFSKAYNKPRAYSSLVHMLICFNKS